MRAHGTRQGLCLLLLRDSSQVGMTFHRLLFIVCENQTDLWVRFSGALVCIQIVSSTKISILAWIIVDLFDVRPTCNFCCIWFRAFCKFICALPNSFFALQLCSWWRIRVERSEWKNEIVLFTSSKNKKIKFHGVGGRRRVCYQYNVLCVCSQLQ